ncbi:MAG: DUF4178 domain-containing protein [Labilithrix sp.]|nr:DUF4178 domain-containing protein [Labilithrix sp.]MCW5814232.1 DUF4178 domain-containing protein [Labilithrix sp.]
MTHDLTADLAATSILTLGAKGTLEGRPFELTGRRCFRGRRGNLWNEWTLSDVPCFLSEAAGSFTLFREGSLVSAADALLPGDRLPWIVVERGTATRLADWGEVEPPPEPYDFLDLCEVAPAPRRASVAQGRTFLGRAIDPRALGLALAPHPPRLVAVPDVSPPSGIEPWLVPGDRGALDGVEYTVLGLVARVNEEGERWQEYCMYSAGIGLRWLVAGADGRWSYVAPVEAGTIAEDLTDPPFFTKLEWASGELPWRAERGELTWQQEHGDLTLERVLGTELSWSRATPLPSNTIARAFDKRALPRPR